MLFLELSPIYLGANIYFIYELLKWVDALKKSFNGKHNPAKVVKIILAVLFGISTMAIYIAFLMPNDLSKDINPFLYQLRRTLKVIGNYHLGVDIYLGIAFVVIWLGRLVEIFYWKKKGIRTRRERIARYFSKRRSIVGLGVFAFIVFIVFYGGYQARNLKVNEYEITVNKDAGNVKDLKVVLVADLHMGYNIDSEVIEDMAELVNAQNPDLVLIAGDIFDNEYEALDDPEKIIKALGSIKPKYGMYAVYGNHDIDERIIGGFTFGGDNGTKGSSDLMDELLVKSGVELLHDEYVLIDDSFYVYGRLDYSRVGKWSDYRLPPEKIVEGLDLSKPLIVMDHEPRELDELALAGVDVDLCGHTHDGQFFPLTVFSRIFLWENSAGYLKKGNMHNIVTSGVGLFGPNMRVGSDAEICSIDIHFNR